MAWQPKPYFRFLLWILAGVMAIVLSFSLDNPVDTALDVSSSPTLHQLAWWFSKLGEGWVAALAGVCFVVLFMILHRPGMAAKIFFVVAACVLTGAVGLILRVLIGRTRPSAHAPQGFYGPWYDGHWIIGQHDFNSFPSGHAATAVGLAAAAWLMHRGWGMAAAVFALAVVWSRIALQSHHLSDVVASAVLAIPLSILLKKVLLPSVEFQFGNLHRAWQKNAPLPAVPEKVAPRKLGRVV